MTEMLFDQPKPATKLRKLSRNGAVTIGLCALLILYLAYSLVFGDRGLMAWARLNGEIKKAQLTLTLVQTDRLKIDQKVSALHPENIDSDMLEERVRAVLGLGRPGELVILLHRTESPWPINSPNNARNNNNN